MQGRQYCPVRSYFLLVRIFVLISATIGGLVVIVMPSSAFGQNVIIGGKANDQLMGTSGNDTIIGLDGNDQIYGLGGSDKIIGGEGNDQIYGNDGDDKIYADSNQSSLDQNESSTS